MTPEQRIKSGLKRLRNLNHFDLKGFHFIVLDANYGSNGVSHFFTDGADWEDTNITPEQLDWLQEDLKKCNKPIVIFCHHPLFEYYKEGNKLHRSSIISAASQFAAIMLHLWSRYALAGRFINHILI